MASSKRTTKFVDIKDLEEGDIIEFERAGGLYFHCGIYDGNNGVYHRAAQPGSGSRAASDVHSVSSKFGTDSNKAEIRKDDLRQVAGSSSIYKTNMLDKVIRPLPRKEILKRANKRLGEKGYNVIYKNCQHFCTEVRYGISIIMQDEAIFGLRTEYSYKKNRVLVNIVNLPKMSLHRIQSAIKHILPIDHSNVKNVTDISPRSCRGQSQRKLVLQLTLAIPAGTLKFTKMPPKRLFNTAQPSTMSAANAITTCAEPEKLDRGNTFSPGDSSSSRCTCTFEIANLDFTDATQPLEMSTENAVTNEGHTCFKVRTPEKCRVHDFVKRKASPELAKSREKTEIQCSLHAANDTVVSTRNLDSLYSIFTSPIYSGHTGITNSATGIVSYTNRASGIGCCVIL